MCKRGHISLISVHFTQFCCESETALKTKKKTKTKNSAVKKKIQLENERLKDISLKRILQMADKHMKRR